MAINKFLGNSIIKRLEETKFKSIEEIRERLKPSTEIGLVIAEFSAERSRGNILAKAFVYKVENVLKPSVVG